MRSEVSKYDSVVVALSYIAELIKHNNFSRAEKMLEEIIAIADDIEDIDEKFSSFFQIARSYLMINNRDKASEIFDSLYEELEGNNDVRSKFYRLVIKIEKLKYGLEKTSESSLEEIRKEFLELVQETKDRSIMRYYLAFMVVLWAPQMLAIDRSRVIRILNQTKEDLGTMRNDPQFAELLSTIAEVYVSQGKYREALSELKAAVRIYLVDPKYFRDSIESIIRFVKEKIPDKYDEFVKELHAYGFEGEES